MATTLEEFLTSVRDVREYERGLAVQMAGLGYPCTTISSLLHGSKPFISKWKKVYAEVGVGGLGLGYAGAPSYLTSAERAQVLAWIAMQETCDPVRLQAYIEDTYHVTYQSHQSYYDLLEAASLSWKKVQASNPKKTTTQWQPNAKR